MARKRFARRGSDVARSPGELAFVDLVFCRPGHWQALSASASLPLARPRKKRLRKPKQRSVDTMQRGNACSARRGTAFPRFQRREERPACPPSLVATGSYVLFDLRAPLGDLLGLPILDAPHQHLPFGFSDFDVDGRLFAPRRRTGQASAPDHELFCHGRPIVPRPRQRRRRNVDRPVQTAPRRSVPRLQDASRSDAAPGPDRPVEDDLLQPLRAQRAGCVR